MQQNEIEKILSDAGNFLQQERLLFGNTIYREPMKQKKKIEYAAPEEPVLFPESAAESSTLKEVWESSTSLDILNQQICTCLKCALGKTRTKFVFGVGNPNADVMVIGEAPGADEDAQGEPFVGRAGQLLNKILEAVQFKREEVFIANILKCRPPNNRKPLPEETATCEPYLWKQIELIKPKFILCLGLTAAQTLLRSTESMGQLRQSTHMYRNTPVIVTYHPAALLRNPNWKRPTWEDVQRLRKMFDEEKVKVNHIANSK
ncbi:MAG: uracil-DNA glycosylase [Ignavibacteriales bacterium]|nr:uracil-DNA glycosylase [Ignavibacteriales bacterium]